MLVSALEVLFNKNEYNEEKEKQITGKVDETGFMNQLDEDDGKTPRMD